MSAQKLKFGGKIFRLVYDITPTEHSRKSYRDIVQLNQRIKMLKERTQKEGFHVRVVGHRIYARAKE